ncbi:hypothetical protein D046_6676B, partial [Vibrio parahaemolyticus V-223/04]
GRH